jgi:hypothetical protein
MPMHAAVQRPAAVVNPLIWCLPVIMIVPAPRNPIPLITCAPRRVKSVFAASSAMN